jgi:hypothetical protein
MPAIVDAHGHLGFLDAATGKLSKANFTRENYIDHLQRYAYHGVAATISVRKISKVYLRGQEVDRAGLRAKWQAHWSRSTQIARVGKAVVFHNSAERPRG